MPTPEDALRLRERQAKPNKSATRIREQQIPAGQ